MYPWRRPEEAALAAEPQSSSSGGGRAPGQDGDEDGKPGSPQEDHPRVTVQPSKPQRVKGVADARCQLRRGARGAQCRKPGCVHIERKWDVEPAGQLLSE